MADLASPIRRDDKKEQTPNRQHFIGVIQKNYEQELTGQHKNT